MDDSNAAADPTAFLGQGFEVRDFAAGEVIVSEGEPGDCMFILVSGTVDVECGGRHVAELGPGTLFGEMSLINREPRSATVRARTATRAAPINRQRFLYLTEQTPFFALRVMQMLSDRLRRMTQLT